MSGGSTAPGRMFPALTERNRPYWTGGADGRLLVPHCGACDRWASPPALECPACGSPLGAKAVSGRGTVYTHTVNHHPFNPGVPLPYVVAIVELEEQTDLRIATNIVECEPDSVVVGMPVQVRFERHDGEHESVFAPVFGPRTT